MKTVLGKLEMGNPLEDEMRKNNFRSLRVTIAHGIFTGNLPPLHNDPFDRVLVAQAVMEGLALVTRDEDILRYDVNILMA